LITNPEETTALSSLGWVDHDGLWRFGRQPLEAVALPGGKIVARDWKTGDLLLGTLERRWFG